MIERQACDALKAELVANVTGMSGIGKVAAVAKDASRDALYPSLQVVPMEFAFTWSRAIAIESLAGHRGLWRAGTMAGDVQLRVVARTAKEREPLEVQVVRCFGPGGGSMDLSTGALTIEGVVTTYSASVRVKLMRQKWVEEKIDERRRYSYLTCRMETEILYVSADGTVPKMTSIVLQTTHDMFTAVPPLETTDYQVNADGAPTLLP